MRFIIVVITTVRIVVIATVMVIMLTTVSMLTTCVSLGTTSGFVTVVDITTDEDSGHAHRKKESE